MEIIMSPLELQQELNRIVHDNESGLKALSELMINDVKELCESHDIIEPGEITAIMNMAQFNFEFKFGFHLAMMKLKAQTNRPTKRDTDEI